jgi:competence protein ComEA
MDVAPVTSAVAAAPPTAGPPVSFVGVASPLPTRSPHILSAWPHCAQWAGVFLLGVLSTLLGVQVVASFRAGEPADILDPHPVTYRVDLNEARRAELLQLPGVGPNLADRIEDYRRTHGGFRSVDDLRKVAGVGPATMEKLRPLVCVRDVTWDPAPAPTKTSSSASKVASLKGPVDINAATLTELQTLPGIGPKLSQRIVDERERKAFAKVEDLRRVQGIGVKTLERLKPYVTVKEPAR